MPLFQPWREGALFCSPSPLLQCGLAQWSACLWKSYLFFILLLFFLPPPITFMCWEKCLCEAVLWVSPGPPSSPGLALSSADAAGEAERHGALPVGHEHHPR